MKSNDRTTTVTEKGQVTIPVAVRHALGVKPRDRVVFDIDPTTGQVTIQRVSSVRDVFGSVAPRQRPENFQALRTEFEEGVADEVIKES